MLEWPTERVDEPLRLANVTAACLFDVGRPDLARLVIFFQDDDGTWYLEPMDDVEGDDLALMLKAEQIAKLTQS